MLVTFTCPAYADITLFGDVAVQLLKLMGQSGRVPGALLAEDVPAALERLAAAVEASRQAPQPQQGGEDEDEENEPVIDLAHRAWPLIELLRAAAKADVNVMWERGGSAGG